MRQIIFYVNLINFLFALDLFNHARINKHKNISSGLYDRKFSENILFNDSHSDFSLYVRFLSGTTIYEKQPG